MRRLPSSIPCIEAFFSRTLQQLLLTVQITAYEAVDRHGKQYYKAQGKHRLPTMIFVLRILTTLAGARYKGERRCANDTIFAANRSGCPVGLFRANLPALQASPSCPLRWHRKSQLEDALTINETRRNATQKSVCAPILVALDLTVQKDNSIADVDVVAFWRNDIRGQLCLE